MASRAFTVDIRGMTCQDCVSDVMDAVKSVPGVKRVKVSLKEERAVVWADEGGVKT
jgi:copper chaperone CopZ